MNRIAARLFFCVATAASAAAPDAPNTPQPAPSERWFSLSRTSSGYLAAGNLGGTLWAFHVRGDDLKSLGSGSPPMFSINGVVLQVKAVSRAVLKSSASDILDAHRKYEQDYQARTLASVTFRDHDMCRNAKVPHRQWIAQSPPGISQAYVTFEVGDYVMMIVAPFEDERRRQAVARVLDDVCVSFQREKSP
jgi:hypothetical protein